MHIYIFPRMIFRIFFSIRETCTWDTPNLSAIWVWVISWKYRI